MKAKRIEIIVEGINDEVDMVLIKSAIEEKLPERIIIKRMFWSDCEYFEK